MHIGAARWGRRARCCARPGVHELIYRSRRPSCTFCSAFQASEQVGKQASCRPCACWRHVHISCCGRCEGCAAASPDNSIAWTPPSAGCRAARAPLWPVVPERSAHYTALIADGRGPGKCWHPGLLRRAWAQLGHAFILRSHGMIARRCPGYELRHSRPCELALSGSFSLLPRRCVLFADPRSNWCASVGSGLRLLSLSSTELKRARMPAVFCAACRSRDQNPVRHRGRWHHQPSRSRTIGGFAFPCAAWDGSRTWRAPGRLHLHKWSTPSGPDCQCHCRLPCCSVATQHARVPGCCFLSAVIRLPRALNKPSGAGQQACGHYAAP